jgi:hypothetical protein
MQTISAGIPTLSLVKARGLQATDQRDVSSPHDNSGKFAPIDLSAYFNASSIDLGSHRQAMTMSGDSVKDGFVRTPAGKQNLRGIPFSLGPKEIDRKSWLTLSLRPISWATNSAELSVNQKARFLCLAAFCDWDPVEASPSGVDATERVGQKLGEVVLNFEDGTKEALPIRRRFEVNALSEFLGHLCFAAEPHLKDEATRLTDPLRNAMGWGGLQSAESDSHYPDGPDGRPLATVWISALANPFPDRTVKSIRFQAASDDMLFVCGLTLFRGQENPVRYERLKLYRLTLPEPVGGDEMRWKIDIDLGEIAGRFVLPVFNPERWLSAQAKGLGERAESTRAGRYLYLELTASPDATLFLRDDNIGKEYTFELGRLVPGKPLEGQSSQTKIEILEARKVWVQGRVLDGATRRPTPVRLAFRSAEGRYIPPYGHRTQVNDGFFQDYGGDLKLLDSSFAYVDGTFQIELPVGDVYVEVTKGFEYEAVRQKLTIEPGQKVLVLEIPRFVDFRSQGWISADTHVHFLSPTTAILEGQAEGLNLINLLAAQWGDLFTNVADLSYGPLTSHDRETLVWVGTENRQHILGHLSLLGGHGMPVFPMSAAGPSESYIGDPLWTSLAEWADACRERGGLVVRPHFPIPTGEEAADIVLGKFDAIEIIDASALYPEPKDPLEAFNNLRYLDWYRYLNCGYRLPVVGGTDKMSAWMPVGANRAYAYIGDGEFNFDNWAGAVRKGNTFATTGPLLFLCADGRLPGDEIELGAGGGTVEIQVDAKCYLPIHRLEVVLNGRVVAAREQTEGAREITLREKVRVGGPGWLAARCLSTLGPTTNWRFRLDAHTSPVYLRVSGQEVFSESAASYMLTLIEGCQSWVENLAIRPDPERFERIRKLLQEAHDRMHARLHQYGMHHSQGSGN